MHRVLLFVGLPLLVLAGCTSQPASSADRAHSIEGQVWSPYCPGRLLIDCTTRQARELRADIAQRVERGDDTPDILDWVRAEYGDGALARPRMSATGLVIWLVPLVLFAAGATYLALLMRRWAARPPENAPAEGG